MKDDIEEKLAQIKSAFECGKKEEAKDALLALSAEKNMKKINDFLSKNKEIVPYLMSSSEMRAQANASSAKNMTEVKFSLPPEVDIEHVHSNAKLYSNKQIEKLEKYFDKNPKMKGKKVPKKVLQQALGKDFKYSVIHTNGAVYAIYYGKKKEKLLGEGASGKAKVMQNLKTGDWLPLKVQKVVDDPRNKKEKNQEKNKARNENFKKEYETLASPKVNQGEFLVEYNYRQGYDKMLVGMKELYAGQNIYESVLKSKKIPTVHSGLQIVTSLLSDYKTNFLDKGQIHRDMKPDNVVLDEQTGQVRITDLGLTITEEEANRQTSLVGTPGYIAPEIIDANNQKGELMRSGQKEMLNFPYGEASEVYALGITAGEILGVLQAQTNHDDLSELFWCDDHNHSPEVEAFIRRMVSPNPEDRPGVEESLKFFSEELAKYPQIATTRKTAIFDINEYLQASASEKVKLKASLKGADEVWMLDRDIDSFPPDNLHTLYKLQRELESEGIKFGRRIFSQPGASVKEAVDGVMDKVKSENPNVIRGFYYVSKNNVALDEKKVCVVRADTTDVDKISGKYQKSLVLVSDDTIKKITDSLTAETMRLKSKYQGKNETVNMRIELLKKCAEELSGAAAKKDLNFGKLDERLKVLEKNMYTTGFTKSTGEKNIHTLRERVEKNIGNDVQKMPKRSM